MNKRLTTNPETISTLLAKGFRPVSGGYQVTVPAISHHFVDRVETRALSGLQMETLGQAARGSLRFTVAEVSEIRYVENNGQAIPVSVVINDIVFGVHPLNMPNSFGQFGLREGQGTAIAKTALSRPNSRHKFSSVIEGWRVDT